MGSSYKIQIKNKNFNAMISIQKILMMIYRNNKKYLYSREQYGNLKQMPLKQEIRGHDTKSR